MLTLLRADGTTLAAKVKPGAPLAARCWAGLVAACLALPGYASHLPDGSKTAAGCPLPAMARGLASSLRHGGVMHHILTVMQGPIPSLPAAVTPLSLFGSESGGWGGRRVVGCWQGSPASTHLEEHS